MASRSEALPHPSATPLCNTGVHPPTGCHVSFFDWYRATVPISVPMLTAKCLELAGQYGTVKDGPGRFNYLYSKQIAICDAERVATILHGGSNGHPNVEASGPRSEPLAAMLRAGGAHRVTRCDVAVDLLGEGLYRRLRTATKAISDEHRVAWSEITHRDPEKGNTIYLGSRESSTYARIYEKGKADREKIHPDDRIDELEHWVRVELEVKPQKDMREVASRMQPEEFWGISPWTRQLAQEAFDMSAEPIPFHPRRQASDERAWLTSITQYRNIYQRRCEQKHAGDREALALEWLGMVFPED